MDWYVGIMMKRRVLVGTILILLLVNVLSFVTKVAPVSSESYGISPPSFSQQLSMSKQKNMNESFPMPEVVNMDSYDWLKFENCSYILRPGQPMLPVENFVFKFPEGSSVTSIKVEVKESYLHGSFKVIPAPNPAIAGMETSPGNFSEDSQIYNSANIFPEEWYICQHTHGLDPETMTRVEYLVINFYPLRFLPALKEVLRAESISVTIDYVEAATLGTPSKLSNLIITSDTLEPYAIQLAKYKNDTGVSSKVLNTTWIYAHYTGIDNQEKIRDCIKDFVATDGIVYVTIFGDADQVPVRLVYVPDGQDTYTATDLYYADLKGTWDDNHDGLYADQRYDNVSGIPDVYVGRISVSLVGYAQAAVNKIKGYQQQFDAFESWTKRVLLAAGTGSGDGFSNPFGVAFPFLKNYTASININKDIVKLYEAYGNISTGNMASWINKGALFLNFAGHGDPGVGLLSVGWLFYWVVSGLIWNGFGISDVQALTNGYKLPVVTTMACSTARFDDQDCIGEWFVGEPNGGSIAYFGPTRIAWGYPDQAITLGLMGEMDWRIYEAFNEGYTRLGQMWGVPVTKYVQSHIWNYASAYVDDVKTLMEFVLLGDPTLRIGDSNHPETLRVPQDFPTIQSAINAAYGGDTVTVSSGTYQENVVVNKSVSLVGEDTKNTIIDGNLTGNVVNITACKVNINGFTIQRSGTKWPNDNGIYIGKESISNNVSDNIIAGNYLGIYVDGSSNNTIYGNRITSNSAGIEISSSSTNRIIGNNVTYNYDGIAFDWSANNMLRNNRMVGNTLGFGYYNGWSLSDYLNDIDTSNTVNGRPIYYWINKSDVNAPIDAGYVALVNCTRITVHDLSLTRNGQGVLLAYTKDSTITKNNVTNCAEGIRADYSSNNTLSENIIGAGVNGILLTYSSNNNIIENSLTAHSQSGIYIFMSSGNHIYHNNLNDTKQVLTYNSTNVWDNGYPSGGNCWGGYIGTDANHDGIGDAPYIIEASNKDNYPLMSHWTPPDIAVTNVTISKTITDQGLILKINATVRNQGNKIEGFNVTTYGNLTTLNVRYVLLNSGSSTIVQIAWNTTSYAKGPYELAVVASRPEGEVNVLNNIFTFGNIVVTIKGDVNGDRTVNVLDLISIALHLGHTSGDGHTPYSSDWYKCMNTDLNNDGKHNVLDLITCALHMGQHW